MGSPIWPALACGVVLTGIVAGYCLKPKPDIVFKNQCDYVKEEVTNLATENKDYTMLTLLEKIDWCKDEERMESDKLILNKYLILNKSKTN